MSIGGLTMLAKVATALVEGDGSLVEKILAKKIEDMGEEALMNLVSSLMPGLGDAFGASRVVNALETGGESEFNKLRSEWMHSITPSMHYPGDSFVNKLVGVLQKSNRQLPARKDTQPGENVMYDTGVPGKRKHRKSSWAKSRQQWIDQHWRHDWRSQPRDPRGRWTEGRLRHPYVSKGARRIRTARRKRAREAAQRLMAHLEKGLT